MPSGSEYRALVTALRAHSGQVQEWWNAHRGGVDGVVLQGPCRSAIDERCTSAGESLLVLLSEIEEQIRVAEYRASMCDQYAQALRDYQLESDPAASPPPRPAPWVSGGL